MSGAKRTFYVPTHPPMCPTLPQTSPAALHMHAHTLSLRELTPSPPALQDVPAGSPQHRRLLFPSFPLGRDPTRRPTALLRPLPAAPGRRFHTESLHTGSLHTKSFHIRTLHTRRRVRGPCRHRRRRRRVGYRRGRRVAGGVGCGPPQQRRPLELRYARPRLLPRAELLLLLRERGRAARPLRPLSLRTPPVRPLGHPAPAGSHLHVLFLRRGGALFIHFGAGG